jgi:hypothetical protein
MARNVRDHGYGKPADVKGSPRITETIPQKCPECGCNPVYAVEVEIAKAPPQLRRPPTPHRVVGKYIGCAACPYASAMMMTCVPILV